MTFKTIKIALFLVLIFFNAMSQNNEIDSLKSLLPETEDIERAKILYELGRRYLRVDQNIAAIQASLEGYRIAKALNDSLMIIENGRIVAIALRLHGEVDSAIGFFERILPLSRKYENSLPHLSILNNLALAYTYTAQYDKALQLHFQYLEGSRHNHNASGEAIALNNIGLVYYKLKDYRKAMAFFSKAITLKRKMNDRYDLNTAFINLGLCYAYLGDYTNAKWNVQKGVQANSDNSADYPVALGNFAMGVVCFGLKEYGKAENHFLKSYQLATKNDDQRFQFDNVDYLTQVYLIQNRIIEASYYLSKAEALIDKGGAYNLEMIKIYSRFFQMYNKIENHEKAAFYQLKYIQLKDSVYDEELTINLMKVEADYQERENRAKIKAQEQTLLLKEAVISRQHLLNIFVCCMAVMLVLLAILLIRSNRQSRMVNKILDERVKDRTKQLEEKHEVLLCRHRESEILVEKVSYGMRSALASIKGLCATGVHDLADPNARQYIDQVNIFSDHLESEVRRFQNAFSDVAIADEHS